MIEVLPPEPVEPETEGKEPPSDKVKVTLIMHRKVYDEAQRVADLKNTTKTYVINRALGTEGAITDILEVGDRILIADSKGRPKGELIFPSYEDAPEPAPPAPGPNVIPFRPRR
ncbi:MAG: hypothetical protein A2186_03580 [Candidatus Levybacteria bacterium RIFOXYA1_FULL_41_10]|nr:MAG: hypothetical protein UT87_C0029G0002 [Candidatus Levybacteria bacterium GW2011_GWC1_40_19]KKR94439.1 MAG: hypothetical protein UU45_C0010G0017 [Candidatus Levybacteria bacterium GW2011_GWA2_41_15]KKS01649.1 MAG: hypothetical protein UU52_C0009G0002 [Candidatus Levybacteria bacterium GW2011_GWB1_41_21]OGH25202.1 MAG: hypothetical protein A3D82_03125 [Candidatus Levybacteria bacterium RIFCSPHIGHO2_02_FULL_40_29]OGH32107.1 MAG: hypothetical protein A3E70_01805 [Candidatus Levybacteria bact